jgi:glutathione S-transferase
MLKLYYAPGACSLSPHIALREAGLEFTLDRVDFGEGRKTSSGKSYFEVNPKGYVPALELADGELITEGAVIVQYIADLKPEAGLAPPAGTLARVRLQEWLNFIATELHKGLSPLFSSVASDAHKQATRERVAGRLAVMAKKLDGKPWLMGEQFSVADGYAFYCLRTWERLTGVEPPGLSAYQARIASRPAVQAALVAEGLAAKP